MGYTGKQTNNGGNTMMGGSFVNVSSEKGTFTLDDLKVTGYDAEEGAWGELCVVVLNSYGMADTDAKGNKMEYYWYDNEETESGWYDGNGVEKWDAANIVFSAGQGFWIYGEGLTIQTAGQVVMTDVAVKTNNGGNTSVANPFPTSISLANISISGYDAEEGAWGELCVVVLNSYGLADTDADGNKMEYYWYDNEETDAGWYDGNGIEKWDDSTSFPAGQGFWIYGEGLTVQFTNPIVK